MLLEDYGLIGDLQAAALVGRNGGVDWLCLPRFDSASCFSALLGDERHGRWLLAPAGEVRATSRRYRPGTLVLETEFETAEGAVAGDRLHAAPRRGPAARDADRRGRAGPRADADGARRCARTTGRSGRGSSGRPTASSPPPVRTRSASARRCRCRSRTGRCSAEFVAVEGARERLTLTWHLSYEETPPVEDADSALARTEAWWREWSGRCRYEGAYRDEVLTSLIVLKAMTSETTGARDRGADDVAAGGHRRRAQLGLPLLLAARLGARARGAARRRLHRRGAGLPRLPAARRHRRPDERSRSCTGSAASGA